MIRDIIDEPMLEIYIFESHQMLEQLEAIILASEKQLQFNAQEVNEIFRIMHTIKGSSSMMLYNNIASVAHAMEDIFYLLREQPSLAMDFSRLSDLLLNGLDFIKTEIAKISSRLEPDGDAKEMVSRLHAFLEDLRLQLGDKIVAPKQSTKPEHYYIPQYRRPASTAVNHFAVILRFQDGCEMENIRAYSLVFSLKDLASEIYHKPFDIIEDDTAVDIIREKGFELYLEVDCDRHQLEDILMGTAFVESWNLKPIDQIAFSDKKREHQAYTKAGTEQLVLQAQSTREAIKINEVQNNGAQDEALKRDTSAQSQMQALISVNVEKLDRLMNMVGELVIAEAMVTQNPIVQCLESDSFYKAARQLHKITTELQDMVMSIRMVPLSTTFVKMNRIVRDMCRKLDKAVALELIGEETEVDKNIIEKISDPLMHLIRNAIDHGIEATELRASIGKPLEGTIRLEAKNVGSDVHIIISDDGRGLSRSKILDKAIERGLINSDGELSDREVYNLILLPGFSTKESITEYSGRGVGMDVVSQNIEAVGGSVIVESQEGIGTSITLKIPLTLAIIEGMNLSVGETRFTIPIMSIKESFRPGPNDCFKDPEGNEMIMIRGAVFPILRLNRHYRIPNAREALSDGILLMIEHERQSICLFADELIGQQQVVIKPLPNYIRALRSIVGISGCTLLGDGSISLILDVNSISDLISRG